MLLFVLVKIISPIYSLLITSESDYSLTKGTFPNAGDEGVTILVTYCIKTWRAVYMIKIIMTKITSENIKFQNLDNRMFNIWIKLDIYLIVSTCIKLTCPITFLSFLSSSYPPSPHSPSTKCNHPSTILKPKFKQLASKKLHLLNLNPM